MSNLPININVLNHGYVKLLDIMGNDYTPVDAARISFNQSRKGEVADKKLLTYLLKHGHTSPFEQVELRWEMQLPIFVARQIIRHRTANVNEFSQRYAEPSKLDGNNQDFFFYVPEKWRGEHQSNKQSSTDFIKIPLELKQKYFNHMFEANALYADLREAGVCKEQARLPITVAHYTKWVWKLDLHNTWKFLSIRDHSGAQWETRQYAIAMKSIMRQVLPVCMSIWEEVNARHTS